MGTLLTQEKVENSNKAHLNFESDCRKKIDNPNAWFTTRVIIMSNGSTLYNDNVYVRIPLHHNYRQVEIDLPGEILPHSSFSANFQEMEYDGTRLSIKYNNNIIIYINQLNLTKSH